MTLATDTGSSDLWVVSDACQTGTCRNSKVPRYPSSSVRPAGADVQMFYGDSTTGTFAAGTIGRDTATIAGVAMEDQAFGVINSTTNAIVQFNTAGIFGLGFPSGRYVICRVSKSTVLLKLWLFTCAVKCKNH